MLGIIIFIFIAILLVNIFSAPLKGESNDISHHHNSYHFPPFSGIATDGPNASFFDGGNDCGGSSFDSGGDCSGSGGGE